MDVRLHLGHNFLKALDVVCTDAVSLDGVIDLPFEIGCHIHS